MSIIQRPVGSLLAGRFFTSLLFVGLLFVGLYPTGAACAGLAAASGDELATALPPHVARFAVRYRGLDAGTSEVRLEVLPANGATGGPRYAFTNRSTPRGIAAVFLPGTITQRSTFRLGSAGLEPVEYSLDDGGKSTARDVRLAFDHERHRITGVAENHAVDLPLVVGTQDALTLGLQVRWLLQQGSTPRRLVMVEKDKAKEYDYALAGRERLSTALGPLDTVIWSSHRPGSDRVTRTWYAPSLGHLAVKVEQKDGDQVLMQLTLLAWEPR